MLKPMLKRRRRNLIGATLALVFGVFGAGLLGVATPEWPLPTIAPVRAFAAQEATVSTDSSVTLASGQTSFTIPLTIEHPNPFAGVETAIQCGDGVSITGVTYSTAASQAGPKDARGLTWFALFSGSNAFSGTVVATVHATYAGNENTSVVIDHSAFYTKEGSAFKTLNLPLRQEVVIEREGASNDPEPLDPPDDNGSDDEGDGGGTDGGDNSGSGGNGGTPGAGNPPSGALVSYTPPTSSTGTSGTGTGADDATGGGTTGGSSSQQENASDEPSTLSDEQTPLTDTIPGSSTQQGDGLLLSLVVIALTLAVVLGFFLIARKRGRDGSQ